MKNILLGSVVLILIFLITIYFYPISFQKAGMFCSQQIINACHTITGECRDFPNSCRLPYFWKVR